MSTPTPEAFLICDDAPDPAPAPPSGEQPAAGTGEAPEAPFDPSRWVMHGWRDGSRRAGPALTCEQTAAAINTLLGHSAPLGPCARCHTPHHRYGDGGHPLCPACRAAAPTP